MTQSPQFGAPPGWRGAAAGEPGDAMSSAPQKTCTGLTLPMKRRAELAQHAVGLDELAPEQPRRRRVVGGVLGVLLERDRLLDLDRDAAGS